MTVEEFWRFSNRPENSGRILELVRGEVVELLIPYLKHGVVCATAGFILNEYARRRRIGLVLGGNAGVILAHTPQSVVGPDVAYYTSADVEGQPLTGWSEELPTLAVEVTSQNDDPAVTRVKVEEYLRNGVPVVWLIDTEEKTVRVFRSDRPPALLTDSDELTGGDELPGLLCEVADFFRLPAERAATRPQPPAA